MGFVRQNRSRRAGKQRLAHGAAATRTRCNACYRMLRKSKKSALRNRALARPSAPIVTLWVARRPGRIAMHQPMRITKQTQKMRVPMTSLPNNGHIRADPPPGEGNTLDPSDWPAFRTQAHRMLDDILDYVENIRERPVWQPIPGRGAVPLPRRSSRGAVRSGRRARGIHALYPALRPPAMCIPASWAGCTEAARPWACWRRCWRRA